MSHAQSIPLHRRAGFSIVGMLVTMVCMVVLFAIMMTSLSKVTTGQGSQQGGTVRSMQDELNLYALYQSMAVHANENKGEYLVPSEIVGGKDTSLNNTANLFSAMVMKEFTTPHQLIAGNEYSGYVDEKTDYDFSLYNPNKRIFWDPTFQADLAKLSNTSYAHMPLFGERFRKQWKSTMDTSFPLVGNRGPKDGVNSTQSMACGKNGIWGGHIAFGDGHIVFVNTPTPSGVVFQRNGQNYSDNIFIMDDGAAGVDAIISFTKTMGKNGPELQFD